jgi:hypothetical protein
LLTRARHNNARKKTARAAAALNEPGGPGLRESLPFCGISGSYHLLDCVDDPIHVDGRLSVSHCGSPPWLTGNHFIASRPASLPARCRRLLFLRLVLRKKRPSIASMTNVKAATADDGSALATSSCSFRLVAFEGLPFALKILARHFPGSFSNALISNPLYCMRDPLRAFTAGRKDEQKLAAANLTKNAQFPLPRRL